MQTEFARGQMITQQIRAWDVLDGRVLEAMQRVPREEFVPERFAGVAFADTDIPLRPGQHMLAPKIVGRLLQALDARPGMRALVIGCGTGFVPACLSAMGASVRNEPCNINHKNKRCADWFRDETWAIPPTFRAQ